MLKAEIDRDRNVEELIISLPRDESPDKLARISRAVNEFALALGIYSLPVFFYRDEEIKVVIPVK